MAQESQHQYYYMPQWFLVHFLTIRLKLHLWFHGFYILDYVVAAAQFLSFQILKELWLVLILFDHKTLFLQHHYFQNDNWKQFVKDSDSTKIELIDDLESKMKSLDEELKKKLVRSITQPFEDTAEYLSDIFMQREKDNEDTQNEQ